MIEEKTLNEWVSELQRQFQEFMPHIDKEYPKIYFAGKKDIESTISEIDDELDLREPLTSSSQSYRFAEFLHGNLGDAVLIYARQITSEDLFPRFAERFWTQLGYFYMVSTEPQEWFDFFNMPEEDWEDYVYEHEDEEDPELSAKFDAEYQARAGYRLWHSFAASAIANILVRKYFGKKQREAKIVRDRISEEETGMYLAALFTHDIEDSALSMPDNARHFWDELKKIIEPQYQKDSFWITDEKTLSELGEQYFDFDLQFIIEDFRSHGLPDLQDYRPVREFHRQEARVPSADELKKKQKAKRKAQKQARKNGRRKK